MGGDEIGAVVKEEERKEYIDKDARYLGKGVFTRALLLAEPGKRNSCHGINSNNKDTPGDIFGVAIDTEKGNRLVAK